MARWVKYSPTIGMHKSRLRTGSGVFYSAMLYRRGWRGVSYSYVIGANSRVNSRFGSEG